MPSSGSLLVFYVNGKKVVEPHPEPQWTLLYYLRSKLRLCGTKLGCGEGGCGACTVMVSKFNREEQRIEHTSVNACLAPVCSLHGLAVTTVEGIGSTKNKLHPVQDRMYKSHGSQCGFCTPGIVMSMYTLLRNKNVPNIEDIKDNLQGNLCRCTGYRPILQGFKSFTTGACCGDGNGCCKNGNDDVSTELTNPSDFIPYDHSQEPIFPPELQISSGFDKEFLAFEGKDMKWFRPTTLEKLLDLKSKFSEAKLIVGNTEVGIEMKFKHCAYGVIIDVSAIPELNIIHKKEETVVVGGSVKLSRFEETLREIISTEPEFKTRIVAAFLEMLRWFAGRQIRNVASLAGNIVTASPISDLNPLLMASDALLHLVSKNGVRTVKMDEKFFVGYRKTLMKEDEVLLSVSIPYSRPNEFFYGFKQAQRREDDIAIVNAGMRVLFDDNYDIIQHLSLAFGGMAPTTVMATKTMETLRGKRWTDSLMTEGCRLLLDELPLDPGAPGGMVHFRRTLTLSFFFKFYLKILKEISKHKNDVKHVSVPNKYKSAISNFHQDLPKASQLHQIVASGQRSSDPVGRPVTHQSGALQATGEAVYCNDVPEIEGELHMALVTSTRAHAKILSVDASPALALDGVHAFFSADDFPGERNCWGIVEPDEQYCATDKVTCQGQVIGCVIAVNKEIAQKAARLVRVEYANLKPIITIEDAISADSFFDSKTVNQQTGNVDQGFLEADHAIEGEMRVGGQEHFYLETQCGNVVPKGEHDELEVTVACQSLAIIQMDIAKALGIPANRVVVKTKRLGGGFGGKETRPPIMAILAALAAYKLQRPIRYMLDRDEDMAITGGRHPYLVRYKVGFTSQGKITALQCKAYSNGGNVLDVSAVVLESFVEKLDNAYKLDNVEITGILCKTNLPTNTAYRGFGAPQAAVVIHSIVTDIALFLKQDPVKITLLNMYTEGDKTHLGQELKHCTLGRCWNQCLGQSDYYFRREAVDQFNRENRWKKRGLAVVPLKYGIGYTIFHLNQGAALVHIYLDGTVLVSHGGVEMGQGLHTKVIQVASRALQIAATKIHVSETSTDKVPNATQTAASMSTDLFAMAVMKACQELRERLEPFVREDPKATWEDWVQRAYKERVSLSATGFHRPEQGKPFLYYSYGAACSEVEIDCLTGDHHVLRTDIVMDVGESINPAIDIGQIEGAFIQGYGLYTLEELKYSPDGYLYTRGPGTYKIPGFGDIPSEFNVSLLKGSPNVHAIYSSKAIGEPPLLLACSVFLAIKDAISSARADAGIKGLFRLDSPATAERIRMACTDQFTQKVNSRSTNEEFVPWSVSA